MPAGDVVLVKRNDTPGVVLHPEQMPIGNDGLTAADFGVQGPIYEDNAVFASKGIPSILSPFELSADQTAWQLQAEEWARNKEAAESWELFAEVADCEFRTLQQPIPFTNSDCTIPTYEERQTYTGTMRSDKGPIFYNQNWRVCTDLNGHDHQLQQEQIDFSQVYSFTQDLNDPYRFGPNKAGGGRFETFNCGTSYVPQDGVPMPIAEPPNPQVPSYIPAIPTPAKGPTGPKGDTGPAPVILYGQITKGTDTDIQPRPLQPEDPGYGTPNAIKLVGTVYCPCTDGVDGADGRDGRDGVDGATGPKGDKGDTGAAGPKGEKGRDAHVNQADYELKYWMRPFGTDEAVERSVTVPILMTDTGDLQPLYQELFYLLTQILYRLQPAGPVASTILQIEDLADGDTIA